MTGRDYAPIWAGASERDFLGSFVTRKGMRRTKWLIFSGCDTGLTAGKYPVGAVEERRLRSFRQKHRKGWFYDCCAAGRGLVLLAHCYEERRPHNAGHKK